MLINRVKQLKLGKNSLKQKDPLVEKEKQIEKDKNITKNLISRNIEKNKSKLEGLFFS